MIAITLAAGLGSRMGDLTRNHPKVMISFQGKTLLEKQSSIFQEFGLLHYIVTGYKEETVPFSLERKSINPDYQSTNMVFSLFCLQELLEQCIDRQDIIISYGDIIFQKNVFQKLIHHSLGDIQLCSDQNWFAYWSARMNSPLDDVESFRVSDEGYLIEIGVKPTRVNYIQGQYIGLFKISKHYIRHFLKAYEELAEYGLNSKNISMTSYLNYLISKNHLISPVTINGGWLEFDTQQDYELYNSLDANGKLEPFYDKTI